MRRFKQALSKEECGQLLSTEKRGVLAVNGDGGYPYAFPINFYYSAADNAIYFHSAREGHKIDSLKNSDKVCFTAHDSGEKSEDWSYFVKSVVVFGTAEEVTDESEKREKAKLFGMKYYPTEEELDKEIEKALCRVRITKISIAHITGKRVHEK